MKNITVSALEYQGLLTLEQMVRMALVNPECGEFIAVALESLTKVRSDLVKEKTHASNLVTGLIKARELREKNEA